MIEYDEEKWEKVMGELEDIIFDRFGDVRPADKIAAIKLLAKLVGKLDGKLDDLQDEVLKWLQSYNDRVGV